jgi:hypothetical protein
VFNFAIKKAKPAASTQPKRGGGGGGGGSSGGPSGGGGGPAGGAGGAGKSAKFEKEVSKSEAACFQVTQAVRSMGTYNTYQLITPKYLKALRTTVVARQSEDLQSLSE